MALITALALAAGLAAPPKNWDCVYDRLSASDRQDVGMYMAEDTANLIPLTLAGERFEAAGEACLKANGWTDAEYKRVASHLVYRFVEDYAASELEGFGLSKINLDSAYLRVPKAVRLAAEETAASDDEVKAALETFVKELADLPEVDEDDEDYFFEMLATYTSAHQNVSAGR